MGKKDNKPRTEKEEQGQETTSFQVKLASYYPFFIIHGTARLIIFLSAIITAAYSNSGYQTLKISGYKLEASYKGNPAFAVLRVASWVVIGSTPFITFYLHKARSKRLSEEISRDRANTCFVLLLYDMIMAAGMISGWAAAGATYYTCLNGNIHLAWIPICDLVKNYCKIRFATLISSSVTIFGFTVASMYSAYVLRTLALPLSTSPNS